MTLCPYCGREVPLKLVPDPDREDTMIQVPDTDSLAACRAADLERMGIVE